MADPTQQQTDARDIVNNTLSQYGLSSLTDWAWKQIVNGASADEILLNLRQTAEYKARFSGLIERQSKGLPPMSEGEAVAYEKSASDLFHQAGLPGGFYDSSSDFQGLIGGDVSLTELTQRVNNAYLRVVQAPVEVRNAYSDLFGASGDAALASIFLDDKTALPVLEQQAAAAEFAGTGTRFGFPIQRDRALQAGQQGITSAQTLQGFQQLSDMRGLFTPTVGEANVAAAGGAAPVSLDTGEAATFGLGNDAGAARTAVANQQQERQGAQGGAGGATITQRGVKGLGSSQGA